MSEFVNPSWQDVAGRWAAACEKADRERDEARAEADRLRAALGKAETKSDEYYADAELYHDALERIAGKGCALPWRHKPLTCRTISTVTRGEWCAPCIAAAALAGEGEP